jgi:hypothetical protein
MILAIRLLGMFYCCGGMFFFGDVRRGALGFVLMGILGGAGPSDRGE